MRLAIGRRAARARRGRCVVVAGRAAARRGVGAVAGLHRACHAAFAAIRERAALRVPARAAAFRCAVAFTARRGTAAVFRARRPAIAVAALLGGRVAVTARAGWALAVAQRRAHRPVAAITGRAARGPFSVTESAASRPVVVAARAACRRFAVAERAACGRPFTVAASRGPFVTVARSAKTRRAFVAARRPVARERPATLAFAASRRPFVAVA
ncbi:hypothetical protein [Paraburkholderia caballeronis]|uniref:hypothetical protein n=1 Tax=Paraburkholderia caballeronis TaxID=416943 RepID=UPI003132CE70